MADDNNANYPSVKLSDYAQSLSPEARQRYVSKLRYQGNSKTLPDPYNLKTGWVDDPSLWPDISFTDIYFYLIDTPGQFTHDSLRAYKSLKAYEYVKSGHVLPIFYYDLDSPYCILKTKVIPSQHLCDEPHQPWVCVKKSEGTVYCAHCTCIAGLGEVCSHVAALLFKVDATVRAGLTSKARTSDARKRNAAYMEELQPIPMCEFDFSSGQKKTNPIKTTSATGTAPLPDLDRLKALYAVCPDAVFFKTVPPLDEEETDTAEEDVETSSFPPPLTSLVIEDDIDEENINELCDRQWRSVEPQYDLERYMSTNCKPVAQ
ncbi:uncharacterized protein LOC127537723 [Acanthochromis polyacanthus]|uniref:uncharacterized protein LOC127537723 n=1 Tax=Acanthochromis polyacanthus TaxID=80966 RepID=UPI0022341988|nr:uncharacterized protein LOC127537723 [Acanthochromis polyacanthus]